MHTGLFITRKLTTEKNEKKAVIYNNDCKYTSKDLIELFYSKMKILNFI